METRIRQWQEALHEVIWSVLINQLNTGFFECWLAVTAARLDIVMKLVVYSLRDTILFFKSTFCGIRVRKLTVVNIVIE